MIRFLIILLLAYLAYKVLRWLLSSPTKLGKENELSSPTELVQDPVCKTYIPIRDAEKRVIGGKKYYFCSRECADSFERNAENMY